MASSCKVTQTTLVTLPTLEQDQLTRNWLDTKVQANPESQCPMEPGLHAPPTMQRHPSTVTIQPTRATSRITTGPPLANRIPDLHMKGAPIHHHI